MAKRKTDQQPELVRLDGGLCANFVNTGSGKRHSIGSYADLLDWGRRAGALSSSDAQRLERMAGERPADAAAALGKARELRNCLERILLVLARHQKPAAADLHTLSEARGEALAAQCLAPAGAGGWLPSWGDRGGDDLDRMLWPVVLSAVETLSPKYYRKVRQCAAEDCDLILVDRSPGRTRRMCRRCGARSRSRKYYHNTVKPGAGGRTKRLEAERRKMRREVDELFERSPGEEPRPAGAKRLNRNVC